MDHPLDGVRAKLDRAREHRDVLKAEFDAFVQDDPSAAWGWNIEQDFDAGKCVIRWFQNATPPLRWAVILGEFLYCLRSGLDHLAQQLVIVNGAVPSTKTEFPVFKDQAEFNLRAPAKMLGMSDPVRAVICEFQPFRAWPQYPNGSTLWVIHDLCVVDKHRILNLTDLWFMGMQADFLIPVPQDRRPHIETVYMADRIRLENDAELARFSWDPAEMRALGNVQVQMNVQMSFDIALNEGEYIANTGETIRGAAVRQLMDVALDFMDTTLVPRFAPFLS